MRKVALNCPVCGHEIPVYEDERKPSGTCPQCGTRIELPVSAFAVLAARQPPATPQAAPVGRPQRTERPTPKPEPARAPKRPVPPPEKPAAPPAGEAVPLPTGPIFIDAEAEEREEDAAEPPIPDAALDLFESARPRGIMGAYFHRRRRHALRMPTWLLIWLGVLVAVAFVSIIMYVLWWTL